MDLKTFVDMLMHGTPIAILAAAVGVLWQTAYALIRDRIHDKQAKRQLTIEKQKLEYEQQRWRDQLARELTMKLVEARLDEYSRVWSRVEAVAESQNFTVEAAKNLATNVRAWRYSKGGLLAEETTRSAAMAFQKALWEYDGSDPAKKRVHRGRFIFRDAIRADMGLTGDIFQRAEERLKKVRQELNELEAELGIEPGK